MTVVPQGAAGNRQSLHRPRAAIRRWRTVLRQAADDLARVFLMGIVLRVSARLLPRRSVMTVAAGCGRLLLLLMPNSGGVLATMQKSFGMEEAEARRSAAECLAQPFYTYVAFERLLHHQENRGQWSIVERNSEEVDRLRQSDHPFIIATGHFRRESTHCLLQERVCGGPIANIYAPVVPRSLRPASLRENLHWGQIVRASKATGATLIPLGQPMKQVVEWLQIPRHRLLMSADSFWHGQGRSTLVRPFAGMRERPFSVGTATLARLTQCPIIPCATYVDADGKNIVEWGAVISPPGLHDKSADQRITNVILDFLEDAIGRRPTQYVLYIGEERRWNPSLNAWEE